MCVRERERGGRREGFLTAMKLGMVLWLDMMRNLELNQGGSSSCEPMMALASVVRISHSFGITF